MSNNIGMYARAKYRPAEAVTIRSATGADRGVVERLAQLDSSPAPAGPYLIAERAGRPLAAYSLRDRRVIADPFQRTADVVALLEVRARQLDGPARTLLRGTAMPGPDRATRPSPAPRARAFTVS